MAGTASAKKRAGKAAVAKAVVEDVDFDAKVAELEVMAGQKVINDDGSINVIEIGRAGRTPNPRIELFSLNGETYSIPAKPSPALMQRFLRDMRKKGAAQAAAGLLDSMLGEDALDVLAESPEVTEADMAAIYTAITHVVFGKFAKKGKTAADPS